MPSSVALIGIVREKCVIIFTTLNSKYLISIQKKGWLKNHPLLSNAVALTYVYLNLESVLNPRLEMTW